MCVFNTQITSCSAGISAEVCVDVNESVVFSALLCVRVDCSSKRKDRNITVPLICHESVRVKLF